MTTIKKEYAIAKLQGLLIDDSERDYNSGVRDAIRILRDMNTIMQPKVTNPDDYEELFDDMIHEVLRVMCGAKGIELNSSLELENDIRKSIVELANNWHMDLSTPHKEYVVGQKVILYYEGVPQQAIIVKVGYDKYALLLCNKNMVIFVSDDHDSATNYMIELQKYHNVE
jgi:hypothetical protein